MARLKTEEELIAYTLRQLGSPTINIEVTPEQISDNIDKAIERFAYYAYDGQIERTLDVSVVKGQRDYILPDNVTAILNLRTTSNFSSLYRLPGGYVFANSPIGLETLGNINNVDMTNMSMYLSKLTQLQQLFDIPLNYNYNEQTATLHLFEDPRENRMLMEVALEYTPEAIDKIYGHPWIKSYVEALTKITWGNVVGKFSSTLVNGSEINFDRLLSEGREDKERLEEELLTDYMEPLGISVS